MNQQADLKHYRTADYLRTPEDCAFYLSAALEDGDERVLWLALENIASTGIVPSLPVVKPNQDEPPRLGEILKLLHALGFELTIRPKRVA